MLKKKKYRRLKKTPDDILMEKIAKKFPRKIRKKFLLEIEKRIDDRTLNNVLKKIKKPKDKQIYITKVLNFRVYNSYKRYIKRIRKRTFARFYIRGLMFKKRKLQKAKKRIKNIFDNAFVNRRYFYPDRRNNPSWVLKKIKKVNKIIPYIKVFHKIYQNNKLNLFKNSALSKEATNMTITPKVKINKRLNLTYKYNKKNHGFKVKHYVIRKAEIIKAPLTFRYDVLEYAKNIIWKIICRLQQMYKHVVRLKRILRFKLYKLQKNKRRFAFKYKYRKTKKKTYNIVRKIRKKKYIYKIKKFLIKDIKFLKKKRKLILHLLTFFKHRVLNNTTLKAKIKAKKRIIRRFKRTAKQKEDYKVFRLARRRKKYKIKLKSKFKAILRKKLRAKRKLKRKIEGNIKRKFKYRVSLIKNFFRRRRYIRRKRRREYLITRIKRLYGKPKKFIRRRRRKIFRRRRKYFLIKHYPVFKHEIKARYCAAFCFNLPLLKKITKYLNK